MAYNIIYTLSCLLLFTSSFRTTTAFSKPMAADNSKKVSVKIYYQAIGTSYEFKYFYSLIVTKGLLPITDLHLCPWGNSIIEKNGTITCQNGERGCKLNIVEACAIDLWPEVEKHFRFIICVESALSLDVENWEKCFDTLGLDRKPIDKCAQSEHGRTLVLKYAKETAELNPPKESIPWVLIEGKPIYAYEYSLQDPEMTAGRICEAHRGPSPPEACKDLTNKSTKFQFPTP